MKGRTRFSGHCGKCYCKYERCWNRLWWIKHVDSSLRNPDEDTSKVSRNVIFLNYFKFHFDTQFGKFFFYSVLSTKTVAARGQFTWRSGLRILRRATSMYARTMTGVMLLLCFWRAVRRPSRGHATPQRAVYWFKFIIHTFGQLSSEAGIGWRHSLLRWPSRVTPTWSWSSMKSRGKGEESSCMTIEE